MEGSATKAAAGHAVSVGSAGSSRGRSGRTDSNGGDNWRLENPFSFKVLQVFTGVGVGCGIGVGVGRPIYLGAIPALQQVLSATSGAMDVFSGAGRHVNSNLRRFGVENLGAGIGCGVGIGHGFGVGIALKPGVIHKVQTCLWQAVSKLMTNFGTMSGVSGLQSPISGSVDGGPDTLNRGYSRYAGTSVGNVLQFTTKPVEITASGEESDRSPIVDYTHGSQALKPTSSEMPVSRPEKVISSFLHNPIFKDDKEEELDKLVGKLRSENNMVQMILKHHKVIDELIEQNEKLQQILVEDLKVSPVKLQTSKGTRSKISDACSDCIECRRKRRNLR